MELTIHKLFAVALLMFLLWLPVHAATILFDNGAPNGLSGFAIANADDDFTSAEDFTLDVDAIVNEVVFWTTGADFQSGDLPSSFVYSFFISGQSTPIETGTIAVNRGNAEAAPEAACCANHFGFKWSLPLLSSVSIEADTTYLFSLHADKTGPVSTYWHYWASTGGDNAFVARSQSAPYSFDSNGTTALAFQLVGTAVPVPAAIWLFGSGLIGLVCMGMRKA